MYKVKLAAVLSLFIIFSVKVFSDYPERVLTIDASIRQALNINHDILINKQSVLFAEQRIKKTQTLYYPVVNFNLNVSKFSNDLPTVVNSASLPCVTYLPSGDQDLYYSNRLSLWQTIYNGGRTSATNELAKVSLSQVQNKSDIKTNEVIAEVKTSFYKIILIQEKIKLYRQTIEVLSKNKRLLNDENNLKDKLEICEYEYGIQMLDFLNLLGLGLDTVIELSGSIETDNLDLNIDQCILWAYQFRPEMKNTQYQETIDGIEVNLLTMEKYPTITFGAAYDWLNGDARPLEKNWYIALNLNLPIFDGGSLFAKIKEKKIQARQATLERSKEEEKIKLQVRKAFAKYSFWYEKASKNTEPSKQKDIIKNLEKQIYKMDVKYNYLKSLFELELALGRQISELNLKLAE
ncbi:MAG: TolC family protein [Endomicrobiaceae bacterium]|nr:TolC family protein [Endomicrobiaceae bacterium]MDD3730564.1 TolC family protein [Endomicrobiaceae bacterium]MDD4166045.1 TolC family protein [Endomicrobiaceae bacterium]